MTVRLAIASLLLSIAAMAHAVPPVFADVPRDASFAFPRDHGAHPDYRTEWWYVTGWLKTADGDDVGFQVTFFRSRLAIDDANPSAFAPKQLLFAHAALADPKAGRLVHDQRVSRDGFGIAAASTDDANVVLDDWRFERVGPDDALRFHTSVAGADVAFDLDLEARGPVARAGCRPCASRLVAEGTARARREPLLQRAAARGVRDHRTRASTGRGHRHRMARSRMVERVSRSAGERLGLDRTEPR